MSKLIYLLNVSLDGFINTPEGSLDWTLVDDELHSWFNDQMRPLGATIYGRRLYEVMAAYWPTAEQDPAATETELEFARIWNPLPKVVFSRTLDRVEHNSRLATGSPEEELARLRREVDGDIGVAGPTIAAEFIRRGLVDEYRLVVHPVILGAGTPYFPDLERPIGLRRIEGRTFASGVVYEGYAVT